MVRLLFAHIKKRLKSVMVFTYSRFNSCCLWSLELLHLFQARNTKKVTNMIILPKIAYPLIFRHDLVTNHGRRATRVIPFKANCELFNSKTKRKTKHHDFELSDDSSQLSSRTKSIASISDNSIGQSSNSESNAV